MQARTSCARWALLRNIGCRVISFFAVEGYLKNLRECRVGTPLRVYTEMIGYDALKLHIDQYMLDVNRDIVLATEEHMMLHVDTDRRKATPIGEYMRGCLKIDSEKWSPVVRPTGLSHTITPVREVSAAE